MTLGRESLNSIKSGLIKHDGAFVQNTYLKSFIPEEYYLVSEWADKYRLLSGKSSAEPGLWKTSRTPYLKEIMDQLSTSNPAQRIVFMKGAQIGGTEAGNNWIGYIIHIAHSLAILVALVKLTSWISTRIATLTERVNHIENQVNNDITGRKVVSEMHSDLAAIKVQIIDIRDDLKFLRTPK